VRQGLRSPVTRVKRRRQAAERAGSALIQDRFGGYQHLLRAIIETEPECVKVVGPDGQVLEMNRAGLAMLEAGSLAEARQQPLHEYLLPEHRAAFIALHQRVMAGHEGVLEFEIAGLLGARMWLETHAVPLRDEHGAVVALLGITRDVSARRQAQAALRERERIEQELRASERRLRAVTRSLVDARSTEQRRLSQELHDSIGQNLSALGLNLHLISTQAGAAAPAELQARLKDSEVLLQQMMASVRDLMAGLRPPMLEDCGLLAGLQWLGAEVGRRSGLAIEVGGAEPSPRLSPQAEIELFRIAQEALNNAVKHARASRVRIRLEPGAGRVLLAVSDDGAGFDLASTDDQAGCGLPIMRERADAVGAKLHVESTPGRGSRLVVELDQQARVATP